MGRASRAGFQRAAQGRGVSGGGAREEATERSRRRSSFTQGYDYEKRDGHWVRGANFDRRAAVNQRSDRRHISAEIRALARSTDTRRGDELAIPAQRRTIDSKL